jgi:uncharacterized damage-inducible protein DinB
VTIERSEPEYELGEREMLEAWLDYERATLAVKCDGLTDEALKLRAVPPSTMSLLGLVRHMADVESQWFRRVLSAETNTRIYWSDDNRDGDFDDVDAASVAHDLTTWRAQCDNARAVATRMALDDCGERTYDGNVKRISLRWVLVHMIEEYARHNGHADLLRECIDGVTGE